MAGTGNDLATRATGRTGTVESQQRICSSRRRLIFAQTSQESFQLVSQALERGQGCLVLGKNDKTLIRWHVELATRVPQPSLQTIAHNGLTKPLTQDKDDTTGLTSSADPEEFSLRPGLQRCPGNGGVDQTARRLRPRRRRRFSTARPPGVCMRLRKPCLFLRRRRLGW